MKWIAILIVGIGLTFYFFYTGYEKGYQAGWDANEKTLAEAWIKYYDVDKLGCYGCVTDKGVD